MNASQNRRTDDATIYLFAKVESIIEIYARSASLSESDLRNRVGELLLSKEMREQLGSEDRVPPLRRTPTGNNSIRSAALAMARRSRSTAQVNNPPNLKGYDYHGTHWTQQPKNKARLRAQMKRLREEFLAKNRKPRPYKISAKALAARRRNAAKGRAAMLAKARKRKKTPEYRRQEELKLQQRRATDRARKAAQRALAAARRILPEVRSE